MNVLIIEDEKPAARRLQRMAEKLDLTVAAVLHSVAESIAHLSSQPHPDLIFLDIQLSDGLSFEIFEQVSVKSSIIFTTAYDEYALQAFKLNSIDYLLKPIDQDELVTAVDKFKSRFRESGTNPNTLPASIMQQMAQMLSNPAGQQYRDRFTARVGEHIKIFAVDEVQLFFSENKGTYLNVANGRNYLLDYKMEEMEQLLDPNKFHRISRQAIVHVNAINDIIAYTNSRLKVKIDSFKTYDLIVSRERVKDFKKWLER
ncbi:LytR/AlgR family response regulator transcription factor [Nonlabens ponticola]|uniref:Response regulator transcription factor n=1 Tax=Nonlabens ponticola TaxID=2496866 RepID=A0A3S9N1C0_9FLAO|nr:LytTR family DNA-binding domain-containing protein [Nonlabens ponticola]AZQ45207.1 response regulator transcription factor [Nonlabens ponticola]